MNHDEPSRTLDLWLSGHNKGKGADCFYDLPDYMLSIRSVVEVREWDQIPDDQCY